MKMPSMTESQWSILISLKGEIVENERHASRMRMSRLLTDSMNKKHVDRADSSPGAAMTDSF